MKELYQWHLYPHYSVQSNPNELDLQEKAIIAQDIESLILGNFNISSS